MWRVMETDNTAGTDSQYPAMWSPLRYFYIWYIYLFIGFHSFSSVQCPSVSNNVLIIAK